MHIVVYLINEFIAITGKVINLYLALKESIYKLKVFK
jgi:hypothetical protein